MALLITDSRRMRVGLLGDLDAPAPDWFGSPGSGIGELNVPLGIARRPGGGFVIADSANHRLVAVASIDGSGFEALGSQGSDVGSFEQPSGVAVDADGRIYITDTGNGRIVRVDDMSGYGWREFGSRGAPSGADPAAAGRFAWPWSLAVDAAGRVAVADPRAGRVVRIDSLDGAGWSASAGPPGPLGPVGVAFDGSSLLVADIQGAALERLASPAAEPSATTAAGALHAPTAVAVAGSGVLALDAGAAAGRLVWLDGDLAGVSARPLEPLGFRAPAGICFAPEEGG